MVDQFAARRWTCVMAKDGRVCTTPQSKREREHGGQE
jgi:hypothetical protein